MLIACARATLTAIKALESTQYIHPHIHLIHVHICAAVAAIKTLEGAKKDFAEKLLQIEKEISNSTSCFKSRLKYF
jgi:hypothetical protein